MSEVAAPEEEECLFFGIDVEKAGRLLSHSLLAVGAAVLSLKRAEILASDVWCIGPPDDGNWEPRCIAEFWKDQVHVLNKIRANGMPKKMALRGLAQFLRAWEAKVTPSNSPGWQGGTILVSDAPSYDESVLNYEFQTSSMEGLSDHTLHWTFPRDFRTPSKWRDVEDCSERVAALCLPKGFFDVFYANNGIVHDHWPSNDAIKHAWTHALCYAATQWLQDNCDNDCSRNKLISEFKSHMDVKETGKRFVCDLALKRYRAC